MTLVSRTVFGYVVLFVLSKQKEFIFDINKQQEATPKLPNYVCLFACISQLDITHTHVHIDDTMSDTVSLRSILMRE